MKRRIIIEYDDSEISDWFAMDHATMVVRAGKLSESRGVINTVL